MDESMYEFMRNREYMRVCVCVPKRRCVCVCVCCVKSVCVRAYV